jgi:DNA-binding response OmpR family regulator
MKDATILIVDDDEDVLKSVQYFLKGKGFSTLTARNGNSAFRMAHEFPPKLILADSQLPGMEGPQLCRALKEDPATSAIPVILMSGVRISEKEQIAGLEQLADDYLVKPLSFDLMLARIIAVMRRFEAPAKDAEEILKTCGIKLNPASRTISVHRKPVHLTSKEFDLLMLFMQNPARVLKPGFLLEAVWGYDPADYNDPHTVEVHVSSLRKKLGPDIGKMFVNVIGYGYKFERRTDSLS